MEYLKIPHATTIQEVINSELVRIEDEKRIIVQEAFFYDPLKKYYQKNDTFIVVSSL